MLDIFNIEIFVKEKLIQLHFDDLKKLIAVLNELGAKGNTVVVIEHNLDVIKSADWIIDLGPAGGNEGGWIVGGGHARGGGRGRGEPHLEVFEEDAGRGIELNHTRKLGIECVLS